MERMDIRRLAGTILKLERLRQGKGQKEVCYGICVPSYLSKIEHGTVSADNEILARLFSCLGISYTGDPERLAELAALVDDYFYRQQYNLDTSECYAALKKQRESLAYSEFAIDWLLILSYEEQPAWQYLDELKEHMTRKQQAYYKLLCAWHERDAERRLCLCSEACDILNNSWAMIQLCEAYFWKGDYSAIHRMEQRIVAAAVWEGNTYQLADCFFMQGNAYACLNMEEMMMDYFERGIRLLQNTAWKDSLSNVYYNIGATCISLKKYELALRYLALARQQEETKEGIGTEVSILHKMAMAKIRTGKVEEAKELLAEMKEQLEEQENPPKVDWLKYEEALMECEEGFLDDPKYLDVLERLIISIEKELHFGHLYFYRDVIVEAYKRQRKYKAALEFEEKISSNIIK